MADISGSRYSRQIILQDWGLEAQKKLSESVVLIIGAGGLGSHSAVALCAAGIGTLVIYDSDIIQIENLHRQYYYTQADCGSLKSEVLAKHLQALNSDCKIIIRSEYWTDKTILPDDLKPDLILDGSDTFLTKYQIHAYSQKNNIPWIYASVLEYKAEVSFFIPNQGACYRCLYTEPPENVSSCELNGVLGSLPALAATRQACEAILFLSGSKTVLHGKLWQINIQTGIERQLLLDQSEDCKLHAGIPEEISNSDNIENQEIALSELIKLRDNEYFKIKIYDIRPDAYLKKALNGIIPADISGLSEILASESVDIRILLICQTGKTSLILARKLSEEFPKHTIFSLKGGFSNGLNTSNYLELL